MVRQPVTRGAVFLSIDNVSLFFFF